MRLDNAVTYFLGQWPAEGPSPDTVRTYAGQLRWLVAYATRAGKLTVAQALEPDFLRSAMAERMAAGLSHPSGYKGGQAAANSLGCAARAMARWLLAQGVPVPDLSKLKLPRVPERVQPRLQDGEFAALESAILRRTVDGGSPALIKRDLAMLWLLGDTGLRAQELCGMTVRDIDWQTGAVLIARGKGARGRALCIIDSGSTDGGRTLHLLSDWLQAREDIAASRTHASLWVSFRGTPLTPNSVCAILRALCQQAGIPGNRPPHAFRRAVFTSHYQRNPAELDLLSSRMGWSDQRGGMAQVYTRGAQIDFARTVPVPSLSARWHNDGVASDATVPQPPLYGPYRRLGPRASPGTGLAYAPAPPPVQGVRGSTRSASPIRGSRYQQ